MGRPKTGNKPKPTKPADDDAQRPTIINMKGTDEYVAWLERLHKHTHIAKTTMVRLALADWAKAKGFTELPPEI